MSINKFSIHVDDEDLIDLKKLVSNKQKELKGKNIMKDEQITVGIKVETLNKYIAEFENPIEIVPGDELKIIKYSPDEPGWVYCINNAGIEAWIPENCINKSVGKILANKRYNSKELEVEKGDLLLVLKIEYNWVLVKNNKDEQGWVPKKILKKMNM